MPVTGWKNNFVDTPVVKRVNAPQQTPASSTSGGSGVGEANSCLSRFGPDSDAPWYRYINECRETIKCDHDTNFIGDYYSQTGAIFGTDKVLGRTFNCRYYDPQTQTYGRN